MERWRNGTLAQWNAGVLAGLARRRLAAGALAQSVQSTLPLQWRPMLQRRVSVVVLCALLASGSILGRLPSCARKATSAGPACCRNEATCPMHQKHTGGALGLRSCGGDAATTPAVATCHRAVFMTALCVVAIPEADRTFENASIRLPQVSAVPRTPPPRIA
jgi:hypothetical protein